MVVYDFNFEGVARLPAKTNAPLVVNPNTMLALPVMLQGFEPVVRRNRQIPQNARIVEHSELAQGRRLDVDRQSAADFAQPDSLGLGAPEAPDHPIFLSQFAP